MSHAREELSKGSSSLLLGPPSQFDPLFVMSPLSPTAVRPTPLIQQLGVPLPPVVLKALVQMVKTQQQMTRMAKRSTQLSSIWLDQEPKTFRWWEIKAWKLMMTTNLPQKIFRPKVRSHLWQISTLGSHDDGMGSIRERLSFRQERKHYSRMIGGLLENLTLKFFWSSFPSRGCLIVAWRQHQKQSLTMVANPLSKENFWGTSASGF